MKYLLSMLCYLFIAGCAYDGGYGYGSYDPYGVDYNSYRDSYGSYGEASMPDYKMPEFRFDYGSHYNITEEDYDGIRSLERMNDRLNRLEHLREWRQYREESRMYEPLGGSSSGSLGPSRPRMPGDSLLR